MLINQGHIYKFDEAVYRKHLLENITKTYIKKPPKYEWNQYIKQQKNQKSLIEWNIWEAYITIQDHKENFPEKPSFRLINTSKSDIGKVSKRIIANINQNISQNTNANKHLGNRLVQSYY